MFTFRGTLPSKFKVWQGGISIDADSGPLECTYFDGVVVEVKTVLLLFRFVFQMCISMFYFSGEEIEVTDDEAEEDEEDLEKSEAEEEVSEEEEEEIDDEILKGIL